MTAPSQTPEAAGLEPCPFCGGEAKVESTGVAMKAARCGSCYAEGPYFCSAMWRDINVSINKAANAWNRRVTAASAQAAIDAEKARADRMASALKYARYHVVDSLHSDRQQALDQIDAALQQETQP